MIPDDRTAATRSQTDVVIQGIKDMLTRGELHPGSRLPVEKDLAAQLGVSRGSLREGVRALATLGVLETRQGDGTYVTSLDPRRLLSPLGFLADLQQPAHAADLLAVRRVLEAESAALAAPRLADDDLAELDRILGVVDGILADDPDMDLEAFIDADTEFHRIIARASGNPALAAVIDTLVGRTFRARLWRAISHRGSVRETQAEHRAILAELVARDPERARLRMSVHLLGVEEFSAAHADEDPHAG
ncbi:FadR/GntR family transcriptional regulator [Microbacterium telephonicum]|uniref:GntR family transcriptional regulator n=1 Tax=Microbacterium telephonicum TaxID=1714841 RepID=A0A498C0A9_9MICO|nr:FCD domain-containing protein [Microbacterium telephonicum]RLK46580.1 GntR family transcriptional regulator [Microbacterium telephonicum]